MFDAGWWVIGLVVLWYLVGFGWLRCVLFADFLFVGGWLVLVWCCCVPRLRSCWFSGVGR